MAMSRRVYTHLSFFLLLNFSNSLVDFVVAFDFVFVVVVIVFMVSVPTNISGLRSATFVPAVSNATSAMQQFS